jgi:hypothetical protein
MGAMRLLGRMASIFAAEATGGPAFAEASARQASKSLDSLSLSGEPFAVWACG